MIARRGWNHWRKKLSLDLLREVEAREANKYVRMAYTGTHKKLS